MRTSPNAPPAMIRYYCVLIGTRLLSYAYVHKMQCIDNE